MNKKVLYLVHGAVIAALYVVLTMLANALGLANYAIQVRFSEALTILPVFTPAAIPGLFLGCIISNTMTGCMLLDCAIMESLDILLDRGVTPPVFMSANVDGGPEFNQKLLDKFADRLTEY